MISNDHTFERTVRLNHHRNSEQYDLEQSPTHYFNNDTKFSTIVSYMRTCLVPVQVIKSGAMQLLPLVSRHFALPIVIWLACFAVSTTLWSGSTVRAQSEIQSRILENQARQFLSLIRQDIRLSDDILINNYLLNLADNLAHKSNMRIEDLHYFVVVDSQINAFAGPGATFFINSGLIDKAQTEGELASVVAHELAHFKQDHLKRLVQNYESSQTPFFLAVLAGIAMGGDAGIATVVGAQAARVESMIDHTLAYEREADAVGLQILVSAGYDPREAISFMLRLEQHIREQGIRQSNIHNTHPITPERVASFKLRVAQAPTVQAQKDNHAISVGQDEVESTV